MLKKRLNKILVCLEKYNVEGILISCPVNIFYLTGLDAIEGYLLISSQRVLLFTDFRYQLSTQSQCKKLDIELCIYSFNIFDFIARAIKKLRLKKVGFEAKILSYKEYLELRKSLEKRGIKFIPTHDVIKVIRAIKEKSEIALIKKSTKVAQGAFAFVKDLVYEGLSEKFVVNEVGHFLKTKADCELAFSPIVASGSLSAQPHYRPRQVKIQADKPILVDLGAKYQGYCSDLTRLLFLSKMPNYINKLIDIIRKAQEISIAGIRQGVKAQEIDRLARSYIEKKGYAKFFGHSLGHGIGLEVHELPSLNAKNQERLKEGMVVTIEPGIYLPGRFGVREERMVRVGARGAEVLDS